MPENVAQQITVRVNGSPIAVPETAMVAVAITLSGAPGRRSVTGEPRGALCGMGICFECRATIDGQAHLRSCQIQVQPGMDIRTDE